MQFMNKVGSGRVKHGESEQKVLNSIAINCILVG